MAKTIESIFLDFYDAKKQIINDDLTFTDEFLAELKRQGITPDDQRIIYALPCEDEGDAITVDEHCTSQCNIMLINGRHFSIDWLNNGQELYMADLFEVKVITKTIVAYEKID